jgi:putative hydrolase of the HAD superfamily
VIVVFDLDDTLYDEINFVRSGFRYVARFLDSCRENEIFSFMWGLFCNIGSGRIFDETVAAFDLSVEVSQLVDLYRYHPPNIGLPGDSKQILENLGGVCPLALITDGPGRMQKNKFFAMGLDQWIEFPVFTSLHDTSKPEEKAFRLVMQYFSDETKFLYFADNPAKDFIAPRNLGWLTVRYKNRFGLYKDLPSDADFEIENRTELLEIVNKVGDK